MSNQELINKYTERNTKIKEYIDNHVGPGSDYHVYILKTQLLSTSIGDENDVINTNITEIDGSVGNPLKGDLIYDSNGTVAIFETNKGTVTTPAQVLSIVGSGEDFNVNTLINDVTLDPSVGTINYVAPGNIQNKDGLIDVYKRGDLISDKLGTIGVIQTPPNQQPIRIRTISADEKGRQEAKLYRLMNEYMTDVVDEGASYLVSNIFTLFPIVNTTDFKKGDLVYDEEGNVGYFLSDYIPDSEHVSIVSLSPSDSVMRRLRIQTLDPTINAITMVGRSNCFNATGTTIDDMRLMRLNDLIYDDNGTIGIAIDPLSQAGIVKIQTISSNGGEVDVGVKDIELGLDGTIIEPNTDGTAILPYAQKAEPVTPISLSNFVQGDSVNNCYINFNQIVQLLDSITTSSQQNVSLEFRNPNITFFIDINFWDDANPDQGTQIRLHWLGTDKPYTYTIYDDTSGGFTTDDCAGEGIFTYTASTRKLEFANGNNFLFVQFNNVPTNVQKIFKDGFLIIRNALEETAGIIKGGSNTISIEDGRLEILNLPVDFEVFLVKNQDLNLILGETTQVNYLNVTDMEGNIQSPHKGDLAYDRSGTVAVCLEDTQAAFIPFKTVSSADLDVVKAISLGVEGDVIYPNNGVAPIPLADAGIITEGRLGQLITGDPLDNISLVIPIIMGWITNNFANVYIGDMIILHIFTTCSPWENHYSNVQIVVQNQGGTLTHLKVDIYLNGDDGIKIASYENYTQWYYDSDWISAGISYSASDKMIFFTSPSNTYRDFTIDAYNAYDFPDLAQLPIYGSFPYSDKGLIDPTSDTIDIKNGRLEVKWDSMVKVVNFPALNFGGTGDENLDFSLPNLKVYLNGLTPSIPYLEFNKFNVNKSISTPLLYASEQNVNGFSGSISVKDLLAKPIEGDFVLDGNGPVEPHTDSNQYLLSYRIQMSDYNKVLFQLRVMAPIPQGDYGAHKMRINNCCYVDAVYIPPEPPTGVLMLKDVAQHQELSGYEIHIDDVFNLLKSMSTEPSSLLKLYFVNPDMEQLALMFHIEDGLNVISYNNSDNPNLPFFKFYEDPEGYTINDFDDPYVHYDATNKKFQIKNSQFFATAYDGINEYNRNRIGWETYFYQGYVPPTPPEGVTLLRDLVPHQELRGFELHIEDIFNILQSKVSESISEMTLNFTDPATSRNAYLKFHIENGSNEITYSTYNSLLLTIYDEVKGFSLNDYDDGYIHYDADNKLLQFNNSTIDNASYTNVSLYERDIMGWETYFYSGYVPPSEVITLSNLQVGDELNNCYLAMQPISSQMESMKTGNEKSVIINMFGNITFRFPANTADGFGVISAGAYEIYDDSNADPWMPDADLDAFNWENILRTLRLSNHQVSQIEWIQWESENKAPFSDIVAFYPNPVKINYDQINSFNGDKGERDLTGTTIKMDSIANVMKTIAGDSAKVASFVFTNGKEITFYMASALTNINYGVVDGDKTDMYYNTPSEEYYVEDSEDDTFKWSQSERTLTIKLGTLDHVSFVGFDSSGNDRLAFQNNFFFGLTD